MSPDFVLEEWSKLIYEKDNVLRLSVVASATSNLNSIAATLNQVASTIGLMQQDVHELKGTN